MRQFFKILRTYVLQFLVLAFLAFPAWCQTAAPAPAAPQDTKSSEASSSDYVGTEVCVTCHADQQKSFEHTIMGNAMAHPKIRGEAWLRILSWTGQGPRGRRRGQRHDPRPLHQGFQHPG